MSHFSEPNSFTKPLFDQLKRHPKRIVFPEGEDERVLRVAARFVELELGVPILLGDRDRIFEMAKELDVSMNFVRVLNPLKSSDFQLFCNRLERIERYRGVVGVDAEEVVAKPHYFAAMMVQYGQADACLGGNLTEPTGVFRPLLHLIAPDAKVPKVFAVTVMTSDRLANFGRDGVLFLADTGLIPDPKVDDLASIAAETGMLARHHMGRRVRVAMLSHSNHGSSRSESALKMVAATAAAREKVSLDDCVIDGEIQLDVALDPEVAACKLPAMSKNERADVLVFPSLDAAHISLKILRHLGGAESYGKLIRGLTRPAAQVPRTATEEMILGTAAALGVEAIQYRLLHPHG
ncbi:MAG: phosphate acyltransferase [Akkermansiaceae bacterium]|jgi:phosphotransacetylase|nr:phosphate acyltransferase [Akkermansiaceae bacterium]